MTFKDHSKEGIHLKWLSEKLVFIRIWWGRVATTDMILDINASKVIYEFLGEHLGHERATFSFSFDLPFLTLADNPSLRDQYLGPIFL